MSGSADTFRRKAGLRPDAPVAAIVEAVRAIPYGRPADRTPDGVVREWKGTCSTKHALLAELVEGVRLVHRVYRVDRGLALAQFGAAAAAAVPAEGLVDVHTYAYWRDVRLDVTFPAPEPWDGRSDMPLACGEGIDHPASDDPWAHKQALVEEHCDPRVREPFIAALSR